MPAITLREVIAELAAGARIVADDDNSYELQYPGTPITGHMLNHELVRQGWVASTPNGGSYRLTDAGRLAYMRSTDELGNGELVAPTAGVEEGDTRCPSCGIRYGYHLDGCAALAADAGVTACAPGECRRVNAGLARCLHGCSLAPAPGVEGRKP